MQTEDKNAHSTYVSFSPSKESNDKLCSESLLTYLIMTNEDNHLNNHQKQTYCLTKKNSP